MSDDLAVQKLLTVVGLVLMYSDARYKLVPHLRKGGRGSATITSSSLNRAPSEEK